MSLLRVDNIQNRFLNSGPIIVGLTTIAGNLICSGITSITDGLVVSAATTTNSLNVVNTSKNLHFKGRILRYFNFDCQNFKYENKIAPIAEIV